MRSASFHPCSIVRVQTWDLIAADLSKAGQELGIDWPTVTGTVASAEVDILCTGPADWLVITAHPDSDTLLRRLTAALKGGACRATNVSDALTRIEIDRPDARVLMAKACALDLDRQRFPPGRCARTRFAGMPVIVRCREPSSFECIVRTSYAEYLISWLDDAALEFETMPGRAGR